MKTSQMTDYASAAEAQRMLGVRPQTLYAYVSRGWIRSIAQAGRKEKLYLREDLLRIGSRSAARAGHGAVAATAMNWGEPIVPSAITEITPAGPHYRGHAAIELARSQVGFEAVAELLWGGVLPARQASWTTPRTSLDVAGLTRQLASGLAAGNLLEYLATVVLMLGMKRGSIVDRINQGQAANAARQVLQTLVGCCGFIADGAGYQPLRKGETIVQGLLRILGAPLTDENLEALTSAFILLADHELSPGTLNARVVASGGGTLHSAIAAALCATSGVDVGRRYESVERFLGRASSSAVLVARARRLMDAGKAVPGFFHPLYPKGDPRATYLLDLARRRGRQTSASRAVFRFVDQMEQTASIHPGHELAVVLLVRMMELPVRTPMAIFALARTAGWVAHVLEQRSRGTLLRPRARFERPQDA